MKEEADKTGYVKLDLEIKIKDLFRDLNKNQIKKLDKIFGGLIKYLAPQYDIDFSLGFLINEFSVCLDIGGYGEDDHYLFVIEDWRNDNALTRYFLLNIENDCDSFYIYGGREVYPAMDHETGVLTFSNKILRALNKKRTKHDNEETE